MENRDSFNVAVAIVEAMRLEPGPERDVQLVTLTVGRTGEDLLDIMYSMAILLRDAAPNLGTLHDVIRHYDP